MDWRDWLGDTGLLDPIHIEKDDSFLDNKNGDLEKALLSAEDEVDVVAMKQVENEVALEQVEFRESQPLLNVMV